MRSITGVRVLLGICVGVLSGGACAQSLLVVNQGDNDVSVVDPGLGRQVATVTEKTKGIWGHEIAVSADGRTAYLPMYGSSGVGRPGLSGRSMEVIDVASRKVVGEVDFGHAVRPHLPVIDPVSGMLYVTTELDNSVTVIDPQTRTIVGAIPTGQAESHMLVLSHDGRRGYTANVGPGTVSVLDMVGRKTLQVIPVVSGAPSAKGWRVQRIAISNDDRLVFTADQVKPRLAVIDTSTNTVKQFVVLPGTGYGTASTRDGRWLLVAVPDASQVAVVDLKSMTVARTIAVPSAPQEVLVRPDGRMAYVSCNLSGKVAAIDLETWGMTVISAGKLADGLAWAQ